jgi:hypothetical protein
VSKLIPICAKSQCEKAETELEEFMVVSPVEYWGADIADEVFEKAPDDDVYYLAYLE